MYLVSYDISSSRRRRKVAKLMENYGTRVQYSVFECKLEKSVFNKMYQELCDLVRPLENENVEGKEYSGDEGIDPDDNSAEEDSSGGEMSVSDDEISNSIRIYSLCGNCVQKRMVIGVQKSRASGLSLDDDGLIIIG